MKFCREGKMEEVEVEFEIVKIFEVQLEDLIFLKLELVDDNVVVEDFFDF